MFGVIVARFHFSQQRSKSLEQTERSLDITEKNNSFKAYFDHREYFNKVTDLRELKIDVKRQGVKEADTFYAYYESDKLYELFFPDNSMDRMNIRLKMRDLQTIFITKRFKHIRSVESYVPGRKGSSNVFFHGSNIRINITNALLNDLGVQMPSSRPQEAPIEISNLMYRIAFYLADKLIAEFNVDEEPDHVRELLIREYSLATNVQWPSSGPGLELEYEVNKELIRYTFTEFANDSALLSE